MVVLSINSGIMDTKELEEQKSVPLWVQQKIGIQNNENIPLSDMAPTCFLYRFIKPSRSYLCDNSSKTCNS